MGLPLLDNSSTVRFASREALSQSWDQSLGRGVLIVTPGRPLTALQTIDVVVEGPGLDLPLSLRAEVVHLDAERAMLRLLAGPVARPASLNAAPVNPFATPHKTPINPFATRPTTNVPSPATGPPSSPLPGSPAATPANPFAPRISTIVPAPADGIPGNGPNTGTLSPGNDIGPGLGTSRRASGPDIGTKNGVDGPDAGTQSVAHGSSFETHSGANGSDLDTNGRAKSTDLPAESRANGKDVGAPLPTTSAPLPALALPAPAAPMPLALDPVPAPSVAGPLTDAAVPVLAPPLAAPTTELEPPPPAASLPRTATPALAFVPPLAPAPATAPRAATPPSPSPLAAPAANAIAAPLPLLRAPTPAAAASLPPSPPVPTPAASPAPPASTPGFAGVPGSFSGAHLRPEVMASAATGVFDAGPVPGPAVVAATLPPYFSGDALHFQSVSDLRGARQDLFTLGAVLAVCDGQPPVRPVDMRLVVGTRQSQTKLRCTLSAAQPGTAVVQVEDKARIAAAFDEVDPPERAPVAEAAARPAGRQLVLPLRGKLFNPTTPAEIMRLPVHRPVSDADLSRPSVPLLLRWLRTTKGVLRVDLSTERQAVYSIICVDGRELRSPVSMQTLGRALGNEIYYYEVTELARAPQLTNTGRTLHLIAEVVRALLAPHEPEAIAAAFPSTKDPRLVRAVTSVVDAVGFQGPHARVIKTNLQGNETIEIVSRGASGARVAWDVLVVLDLFGGLTYVAGEARVVASLSSSPQSEGVTMMGGGPSILDKDYFGALGLHWSSSPADVPAAYQRMRADYLPNGVKRPANAVEADKIVKRLEEAFKVLNDTEARRAYRRATFNMVWSHQAQMLVAQAKLALYRKDLLEARNLLLAAQDMSGSQEAAEMLSILNRKS